MILTLAVFAELAASCGPSVHVDTLAAIAHAESGFHPGAINDNTDKRRYLPRTREEAVHIATDLVAAKRHSVDLGLMQINSGNLSALGMSVADAFEPCKSINAGARVLSKAYRPIPEVPDAQPALLQALSRYNTGHPTQGIRSGYVFKVQASAEQVVPAIRRNGPVTRTQDGRQETGIQTSPLTPNWDVFAKAKYARERGAFTFVDFGPTKVAAPDVSSLASQRLGSPVQLHTTIRKFEEVP
jgi:type IV secretion system protein VirB1